MMKFLKSIVASTAEKDVIYTYLCESADLVDLERRQRLIDCGQAPWQAHAKMKLAGWM